MFHYYRRLFAGMSTGFACLSIGNFPAASVEFEESEGGILEIAKKECLTADDLLEILYWRRIRETMLKQIEHTRMNCICSPSARALLNSGSSSEPYHEPVIASRRLVSAK